MQFVRVVYKVSPQHSGGRVVKIRLRPGESLQAAVRRFRRLCERSGLPREIRKRAYYQKPSEQNRRARLRAIKKAKKAEIMPARPGV